jgi:hypothetical protein
VAGSGQVAGEVARVIEEHLVTDWDLALMHHTIFHEHPANRARRQRASPS